MPSKPLRVLFINDTSRNGGPGRTILYITKFLDPALVHRTILIPREGIVSKRLIAAHAAEVLFHEAGLLEHPFEPLSRPMEREDFAASLPLKLARLLGNIGRATAGFVRLWRRIKREKYDLIFCNGTSAGFLGGALAAVTGVPAIWHVLYPSVAPAIRGLHQRLAAGKHLKLIICVSKPCEPQFDHCRAKVRAIQTALDIEEFDGRGVEPALRRELALSADTVIFGSHGRIVPRKGFIEMVRAAKIVHTRLSEEERRRCRFIVLGDTPQDMHPDHRIECQELAEELGLTGFVQFIGFRADPRAYVADFDVAVVPSIYEDPLPRAVMEAMAMGKAILAFAMGGIAEMVADGTEGRLYSGKPPDIEGLAEGCLAYFRDSELRRRHGAAARARIERDFDSRKHARRLQEEMFRIAQDGP
ncbi:MAG: glycosyltransferase [Rhizomicrobium sp.]|nr:glycosyltransferase [Rhizomicrobium sp.]